VFFGTKIFDRLKFKRLLHPDTTPLVITSVSNHVIMIYEPYNLYSGNLQKVFDAIFC